MQSILSLLTFTDEQRAAVTTRGVDVAVTAGAGSGKTRTLVGRYLSLLEDGLPLRSLVAITFTEKAAREMRTRVRSLIQRWLGGGLDTATSARPAGLDTAAPARSEGPAGVDRSRWEAIYAELDAARIGTIHSLCATILRTHPAQAGIDPGFQVLDEGQAAVLRAQAVESALVWAANDPDAATLFPLLTENGLRQTVATLLDNCLDAGAAFAAAGPDPLAHWQAELRAELARFLDNPDVCSAVADLDGLRVDGTLTRLAGDTLAAVIVDFLTTWDAIAPAWETDDLVTVLEQLPRARQAMQPRKGRKSNWPNIEIPREALSVLRSRYDATLADLLKHPVDWSLDSRAAAALPPLRAVFETARSAYAQAKEQRQALDFDDLEAGAVALLENHPDVRAYWQAEIRAVLVDEFQDTNDRQRRIIYALAGFDQRLPILREGEEGPGATDSGEKTSGRLFIVGDGKQSIYRFRGADVTVFRRVQADIEAAGGRAVNLDLTFRAHQPLSRQLNALLAPVLGTDPDPTRPYAIPFSSLRAYREKPRTSEPFVEFCLGLGDNADEGRSAAAAALADRLWRLHEDERVAWNDIGLLFRASTGFPNYEGAFEAAGIPFVTVAGRGFYDRPEVRDLLNILQAINDPTDDLALAGALRSPAFGLTDGALYLLRRGTDGTRRSIWYALHGDLSHLDPADAGRAARARDILAGLNDLAGRVTVAGILKQLLDRTGYRAILRLAPDGSGVRAQRNVDKLLTDAHAVVSIGEFLERLKALRDVAAREGEAPVEAGEVVQLMTVHRAKGLEFLVVVIADAGYSGRGRTPHLLLDPTLGPVIGLRGGGGRSVMHRLAALRDQDRADAEERRLLYVAATRAKEKLLISGHVKASTARNTRGKPLTGGWLKWLGDVVGLHDLTIPDEGDAPLELALDDASGPIGCTVYRVKVGGGAPATVQPATLRPAPGPKVQGTAFNLQLSTPAPWPPSLVKPVPAQRPPISSALLRRGLGRGAWAQGSVGAGEHGRSIVDILIRAALRQWRFPDQPGFEKFLRPHVLAAGLTDADGITAAVAEVRRLLSRFQAHPLYAEMEGAQRHHQVPFAVERDGQVEIGEIDLLCHHAGRWHIVEFITGELHNEEELRQQAGASAEQVKVCAEAVRQLLEVEPMAQLCFLDVAGEVKVVRIRV